MSIASHPVHGGGTALSELARAQWPEPGDQGAPVPPPGFIASSFPGLVVTVANRCLERAYGPKGAARQDRRTAVVITSRYGDMGTIEAVTAAVDGKERLQPLFFFQSVPNSVAGRVAAQWGLTGPVVCTSPSGDPLDEGHELAELLLRDQDADAVLLVVAEQAGPAAESDRASAVLLAVSRPAASDDTD